MNLIEAIQGVPDYRHARGIRHRLWIILTIVLLGSCIGYWGYKPLAEFTKNHRLSLIKLLDLSPDIQFPSASTFRNIMMSIDFQILAELFNVWAENSLPINYKELFAIDGKCIKSTVTGGNKSYQNFVSIVSVYSHQQGWVVRHQAMENHEKSEISVVEELIKTLSGYHVVITADALQRHEKTVELIIEGENDYIITIKRNQPNLLKVATELAQSSIAIDTNSLNENLHGRKTTRQVKVYPIPSESLPDWVAAKTLIEVNRYGTRPQGKKSRRQIVDYHERHFYLSSLNCSASEFALLIRGHWSIENQLHWVKDVTLNEDNCIHAGGFSPANWAMVRQFLVSLARQLHCRTLPEALRLMANQLQMIFDALFDHSDSSSRIPMSPTVESEKFFSLDN